MRSFKHCVLFFFLCTASPASGQEPVHTGRSLWQSFTTTDTKAAAVTRDAVFTPEGVIYAANEAGLIRFDGEHWRIIAAGPERRSLHQLVQLDDGSFFASTQTGVGKFSLGASGKFTWGDIPLSDTKTAAESTSVLSLHKDQTSDGALVVTEDAVIHVRDDSEKPEGGRHRNHLIQIRLSDHDDCICHHHGLVAVLDEINSARAIQSNPRVTQI